MGVKKGKLECCFHVTAGIKDENQVETLAWNNTEKQRKKRTVRTHSTLVIPDNKTVTCFVVETKEYKKVLDQGEAGSMCAIPYRMAVGHQGSCLEKGTVILDWAGEEISNTEGEALMLLCKGCGSLCALPITHTEER